MRYRDSYRINEREARERSLATVALMRREGLSLRKAAQLQGISQSRVLEYASAALRQGRRGEYWARSYDHIRRTLNFLVSERKFPVIVPITVYDSRTATDIAEYWNTVRKYVRTGDTSSLNQFKNKSFLADGRVYRYVTDLDVLDELAHAGSLAVIESLYHARMAS